MISTFTGRLKIAGASFLILGLVWQHIQATRLGYEVEKSRREAQRLRGRLGALQMNLQTSQSPAQLAANARTRLGMFPAPPDSLRFLDAPPPEGRPRTFLARLLSLVSRDA